MTIQRQNNVCNDLRKKQEDEKNKLSASKTAMGASVMDATAVVDCYMLPFQFVHVNDEQCAPESVLGPMVYPCF